MSKEYEIELSGPFDVYDSLGQVRSIASIRIFDESYAIIDVYVAFASPADAEDLREDATVLRQVMARLRSLGYQGPDFGLGADDLQDEGVIVLEAPEEFGAFAVVHGWKNLADDYLEDRVEETVAGDDGDAALAIYSDLIARMRRR